MLWQKTGICFMVFEVLMFNSSVFCFEILKGKSVESGRLLVGSGRTTNENKDDLEKLSDKYVGDTNGNPSNQPEGSRLGMSKLQRLRPSVQCDNDSMSLRLQGSRVPHFFVETSDEGSVPLFRMPSNCGFSVKRAPRDLALVTNYNGCNVVQQGDAYILPLRFLGVAVKVVCPMARSLSTVYCSRTAMVVNLCTSVGALWVKVNGVWQPVPQETTCGFTLKPVGGGLMLTAPYTSKCWQFEGAERLLSVKYMGVELTLSCPAVATLPVDGQPGTPTNTPMTSSTTISTPAITVAPASSDQLASYPWLSEMYYPYFMPWHFQNGYPGVPPVTYSTTAPATTTTPAAPVVPASVDQLASYPWLHGMQRPYFRPWHFQHGYPGAPPVTHTTTAPTTTTTPAVPAVPASADQLAPYPWLHGMQRPYFRPWYCQHGHPGPPAVTYTTKSPTTTTPAAAPPITTTVPTIPAAPASANQQSLYHWVPGRYHHGMPWHFHYRHPGAPTVAPPPKTQTSTTTATPSTTVAPSNFDQLPYPWLAGIYNAYVPMVSPNSEDTQQTNQMSWMNALPQYPYLSQKSFRVVNPSNVLSYPAQFFPLQVKAGPGK